jgi:hypothetical protein
MQEQLKEHLAVYHYTSDNEVKINVVVVPSSRYTLLSQQIFATTRMLVTVYRLHSKACGEITLLK